MDTDDDDDDDNDDDDNDDDDDDDLTGLDCFYIEKFNDFPPPGWFTEGAGWTSYFYSYGAYAAHAQTGGQNTQAIDSILYSGALNISAYTTLKIGFVYVLTKYGSVIESFPDVTVELSKNPVTYPWNPIWTMPATKWTEGSGIKEALVDLSSSIPGPIHLGWRFKADPNRQNEYDYYLYELYVCGD